MPGISLSTWNKFIDSQIDKIIFEHNHFNLRFYVTLPFFF